MRYRHLEAFAIEGISTLPDGTDFQIIDESALNVWLASDPDSTRFAEIDACLAVTRLVMSGITTIPEESLQGRLAEEEASVREWRQTEFKRGPFIVVAVEGDTTAPEPQARYETADFEVWWDQGDFIQPEDTPAYPVVTTVLNAFALAVPNLFRARRVTGTSFFINHPSGKPVYRYRWYLPPATAVFSHSLTLAEASDIHDYQAELSRPGRLGNVQRLIRGAYEANDDPLRSFLSSWQALETLVESLRSQYEDGFLQSLFTDQSEAAKIYLERTRQNTVGGESLLDRFLVLLDQLQGDSAASDYELAMGAKKIRDAFSHGRTVDEHSLPTRAVRDLAVRYLRAHMDSTAKSSGSPSLDT